MYTSISLHTVALRQQYNSYSSTSFTAAAQSTAVMRARRNDTATSSIAIRTAVELLLRNNVTPPSIIQRKTLVWTGPPALKPRGHARDKPTATVHVTSTWRHIPDEYDNKYQVQTTVHEV